MATKRVSRASKWTQEAESAPKFTDIRQRGPQGAAGGIGGAEGSPGIGSSQGLIRLGALLSPRAAVQDPEAKIEDRGAPYQSAGFFRRLLGDKSNELNAAWQEKVDALKFAQREAEIKNDLEGKMRMGLIDAESRANMDELLKKSQYDDSRIRYETALGIQADQLKQREATQQAIIEAEAKLPIAGREAWMKKLTEAGIDPTAFDPVATNLYFDALRKGEESEAEQKRIAAESGFASVGPNMVVQGGIPHVVAPGRVMSEEVPSSFVPNPAPGQSMWTKGHKVNQYMPPSLQPLVPGMQVNPSTNPPAAKPTDEWITDPVTGKRVRKTGQRINLGQ